MELGEKIKYFRKRRGLTIKQLSTLTGLSSGFISNIERDLNSPSVSNLQQICQLLDINIVDLIEPSEKKESVVIKKANRKEIFKNEDNNVKFESLTDVDKPLSCICITIAPGSNYGNTSWGHNFDEMGLVVSGTLEITVDNIKYELNAGDSVYINRFTPHNYRNHGSIPCITYWFSAKNNTTI
ncbi:MAG: cupin domain-containing protein [Anaeromicrobium sp.]|jgi:transcriptional regulator with XRE-family HTH domain|uniref:cupin domain-containing protein n=1 Tax=Anaeromicrobium sp. TaxID=1929132 RepID=UPI0025F0C4E1|nr:cupin domain-containing protein [Anaeromicrobium sp.]MCT4594968.1 cupin domain-containing protein [Anaeromicrobium sp.]